MPQVFVSWSRETQPVAQALQQWLQAHAGWSGWFSSQDIVAGQPWRAELQRALQQADCALCCIGPSAVASPWVLYESGAIAATRPLLPLTLLVPQHRLPATLTEIQLLNAYPGDQPEPDPALPQALRRALTQMAGAGAALPVQADADGALMQALGEFARLRTKAALAALRATQRADSLLALLAHVEANPGMSPRGLAEVGALADLLVKKFNVVLSLFWLEKHGFVEIGGFDQPGSGQVTLALAGRLALRRARELDA